MGQLDSYVLVNLRGGSPDRPNKSLAGFFWSAQLELHCSFPLGPTFPLELSTSHPPAGDSLDTAAT